MPNTLNLIASAASFLLGLWLVFATLISIVRTFVLPRSDNVWLTRQIFIWSRRLFNLYDRRKNTYEEHDRVLALYAPLTLISMPLIWAVIITVGYMFMFWGVGARPWYHAFSLSGSSLLTLGFTPVDNLAETVLSFSEALLGLGLVALLIAYLPTIYSAFAERETLISQLEVRAGAPPDPVEMLRRLFTTGQIEHMEEVWARWENWFTQLEEAHTTFAMLSFFRSTQHDRSWLTAAGTVLNATALYIAATDLPFHPRSQLCLRAGYVALKRIADFFRLSYAPMPPPNDPDTPSRIVLSREEFEAALAELQGHGIPLKADREQAWRDFSGWRVTYEEVLLKLGNVTLAPPARWTGERWVPDEHGRIRFRGATTVRGVERGAPGK